jgi:1-acyl-sn-glycerol-3-phosphate acyltransferase
MLYSVLLLTLGLVITVFMCFWSIVFSIFSDSDNKVHKVASLWAKILLLICNIKVNVIGKENLLLDKPQIFMANYQSDFDILIALAYIPVQFRWIAKKELFSIPIFGTAMRIAGYIGIDRKNLKEAIKNIDKAVLQIWKGKSIMTFPEDTRSRSGAIKPFKQGAFYLAIETGAPIVPVSIIGSEEIMPQKSLKIVPRQIKLVIGKPIEVIKSNIESRYELMEKVRDTIIKNYNYWQNTESLNIKDLESEAT